MVSEIEQTISQYCLDVKTKGLTAEFLYLDQSPEFLWTPPGSSSPIGYDSISDILLKNASLFKSVDNRYEALHIEIQDDHHALYSARVRSVLTSKRGQVTRMYLEEKGSVIKRKDGWKLQRGITKLVQE